MASGISLELVLGVIIGWYISETFLAGPVSGIASQILNRVGG